MPKNVKRLYSTDSKKPRKLICELNCLNCNNYVQKEEIVEIDYYFLMEFAKKSLNENLSNEIINFIMKMHPKIDKNNIRKIQKENNFLMEKALICPDCLVRFANIIKKPGFIPKQIFQHRKFSINEKRKVFLNCFIKLNIYFYIFLFKNYNSIYNH